MFEITPTPISECRAQIERSLRGHEALLGQLSAAAPKEGSVAAGRRPFVQLAADELVGEDVDEILGYAGIRASNAPIGLPIAFEPVSSEGVLLFPLEGLEQHLGQVASDIVQAVDRAGSMDAFAEQRGEGMGAREYLVGGVLECIRFCRSRGEALVIRW